MDCLAVCIDVFLRNTLVKRTDFQDWISRTSRPPKDQNTEVITSIAICIPTHLLSLIEGDICNQGPWGQKGQKSEQEH